MKSTLRLVVVPTYNRNSRRYFGYVFAWNAKFLMGGGSNQDSVSRPFSEVNCSELPFATGSIANQSDLWIFGKSKQFPIEIQYYSISSGPNATPSFAGQVVQIDASYILANPLDQLVLDSLIGRNLFYLATILVCRRRRLTIAR
jgi:hypothetical protein